ncbi:hypothetical protein niasHS_004137 [Heterodera schachtii]|uniref:Mitochondrial carrier protein n=1 Tax=Heterodera schachtii TaxID=97005 RepID=A0ABD2JKQ4_HETSC
MLAGYEHFIGGVAGGLTSTAICHPFDLLKVRFSANEGSALRPQYTSYWDATRSIFAANGMRGLYRGLSAAAIASPISWGLYFQFYDRIRAQLHTVPDWPIVDNLLAGSVTGALILSVTNPLWVCKTRMCLQYEAPPCTATTTAAAAARTTTVVAGGDGVVAAHHYRGLADCVRQTWRHDGFRGFYKGYVPGLFGTINGAVQFALYNWLKDWRCRARGIPRDSQLAPVDYLTFSISSKCMSTTITFPYQVLRTRLQDPFTHYTGTWDCFIRTLKREGPLGLYKGVLAGTVKQLPYSVITYIVYEQTRYAIRNMSASE